MFAVLSACSDEAENSVKATAGAELTVMDFSTPFSLDPPPSGWHHRTFWFRPAMKLSFATKEGVAALRCETDGGGSIFGRYADVSLTEYPILAWDWYVEVPIESAFDERTKEGDDHPARLFLRFKDSNDDDHFVEIIWSNKHFSPGDYKIIDGFPHYVANGRNENIGRWHQEQIDLLEIYRATTKREDMPKVKLIAIFCDSDDTGGNSVAYFSNVRLRKTR
ncbi:MAG: DUF3047 domain-containing protein [Alphaproteobacteria bacterium]|nr:DUF3047 domain-containing protein [Alphaproteobacteria bacterium]